MPYSISIEGQVFNTDDLTLDEAISCEKATGEGWLYINPFRSAAHCKAIMVAFLRRSLTEDQALAIVDKLTITTALKAVKRVEDDLPDEFEDGLPKAEDGPETTTS